MPTLNTSITVQLSALAERTDELIFHLELLDLGRTGQVMDILSDGIPRTAPQIGGPIGHSVKPLLDLLVSARILQRAVGGLYCVNVVRVTRLRAFARSVARA
ncbi:MAG: hypothetical protein WBA17_10750 [Saprospiraceae bacterium]